MTHDEHSWTRRDFVARLGGAAVGSRYDFVDRTHDDRGFAPRRFDSFLEAAEEAAISRLYGGIHFRAAIENGLAQGRRIGRTVSRLPLRD
jgi:hypothetical protein